MAVDAITSSPTAIRPTMKSMISHRSSVCSRVALLIGLLLPAVVRAQTVIIPKELPNLGKLQAELKQYHDCKGNHGCYTADLEEEAGTGISSLDRRVRGERPGTKLGGGGGHIG